MLYVSPCLMVRVLSLAIYFPPSFVILNRALLICGYDAFMLYRLSTWFIEDLATFQEQKGKGKFIKWSGNNKPFPPT